jgi:hypothetical protein
MGHARAGPESRRRGPYRRNHWRQLPLIHRLFAQISRVLRINDPVERDVGLRRAPT